MAADASNLGAVGVGFQVDLKGLSKDMDRAKGIITGVQKDVQKKTSSLGQGTSGGGFLDSIISGGKQASSSLANLAGGNGVIGRLTSGLSGLGRAFGGMGGAAAAGGAGILAFGAVALGVIGVIGAVVAAVKIAKFAFSQLGSTISLAVNQQSIETSFKVLAQNMGISQQAANDFKKTLLDYNIAGASATRIMQGLLNAQLPLDASTKSLVDVAQRYAVIAGTDTPTAIGTITDAISTLNPELLRQFGIVQTLPQIYESYAQKLGVSADSLNTVQQRQAILNTVIASGTRLQGAQAAAQFDAARGMQILKSNIDNFKAALGRVALPTFTGLLQILVPISRQLGGNTDNLAGKMDSLGQRIAGVVVPAFSRFIAFVRSIPWASIINGAYQGMQIMRILASVVVFTAQAFVDFARVGVAAVKVLMAPFLNLANVIGGVAAIAAKAWQVITGKASFSDLKQTFSAAKSSFVELNKDIFGGFAGALGKATVNTINNVGSAVSGIADATKKFANGFDIVAYFKSLPVVTAAGIQDAINNIGNGTDEMSTKARKALQKLQEDLAKENADFARDQAKAASDYSDSLAELVAQHREQINSIRRDLAKETSDFQKAQQKRSDDYQDQLNQLANADKDRKNDVNTQLAEEIAKGRFADQTKIASLRARLKYEDAANQKAVDEAAKQYDADTKNAQDEHTQRLGDLQTALDKELAIQERYGDDFARFRDFQIADDITKLKTGYATQQAEAQRAHAEKLADLVKNGADEAAQSGANGADAANNYVGALAGGLTDAGPGLNSLADSLGKGIMDSTKNGSDSKKTSLWQKIKDITGYALGGIGDLFGTAVGWGSELIGQATRGIWNMAGALKDAVVGVFNRAAGLLGTLTDFGKSLLGSAGRGIKSALGAIGGAFQSAWNASGLPHFARGGIVQGTPGKDNVTAAVSAGEMILTGRQQQNLFSMLNGRTANTNETGNSFGGVVIENLNIELPNVKNGSDFSRELQLHFATRRKA